MEDASKESTKAPVQGAEAESDEPSGGDPLELPPSKGGQGQQPRRTHLPRGVVVHFIHNLHLGAPP